MRLFSLSRVEVPRSAGAHPANGSSLIWLLPLFKIAMNELIMKTGVTLGNTESGSNWVMKALNPAAPLTTQGIPDSSCLARVNKHFERTVTVTFPLAAANWSLDVLLHPNPWTPACFLTNDGVTATFNQVLNTQLGATDGDVRKFIFDQTEAYRISYASMTAIMDATSITNSGLAAATQYIYTPTQCGAIGAPYAFAGVCRRFGVWPDPPRSYDQLIQMPGTYVGEAKEGCYLPLRIDPELSWIHANDERLHINVDDAIAKGWADADVGASDFPLLAGHSTSWPFGIFSCGGGEEPSKVFEYPNSQRTVGHLAMRNLNAAATIRITYRLGFEFLVAPGATYSPDLRIPPSYDSAALEAYKAISTQLKLAYPASYNDWQKIVKTIADVASTVLPFLPGGKVVSSLVPAMEKGILGIGGLISKKVAQRRAQRLAQEQPVQVAVPRPISVRRPRKPANSPTVRIAVQPSRLRVVRRR